MLKLKRYNADFYVYINTANISSFQIKHLAASKEEYIIVTMNNGDDIPVTKDELSKLTSIDSEKDELAYAYEVIRMANKKIGETIVDKNNVIPDSEKDELLYTLTLAFEGVRAMNKSLDIAGYVENFGLRDKVFEVLKKYPEVKISKEDREKFII